MVSRHSSFCAGLCHCICYSYLHTYRTGPHHNTQHPPTLSSSFLHSNGGRCAAKVHGGPGEHQFWPRLWLEWVDSKPNPGDYLPMGRPASRALLDTSRRRLPSPHGTVCGPMFLQWREPTHEHWVGRSLNQQLEVGWSANSNVTYGSTIH